MVILRFINLLRIFGWTLLSAPAAALGGTPKRLAWYARLVRALEKAGATFIKLGQIASSRPDILPPELCQHLSKLHDRAPAHSAADTQRVIEAAFSRPLSKIFSQIGKDPIASGSIAQVHRARLLNGHDVAVKVRHPGVSRIIETDLRIIRSGARLAGRIPGFRWLSLTEAAEEFSKTVHGQLDLTQEGRNLKRFIANFFEDKHVFFPVPVDGLVHPTVLVESFEEGQSIARYIGAEYDIRRELARRGIEVFLKMIFVDGFVHADLHPGNIFVRVRSGHPEVVLLDCGMVAELSEEHRNRFTAFFGAVASGDGRLAARLMIEHAPSHACDRPEDFQEDLHALMSVVRTKPLSEIDTAQILSQIMSLLRTYRVKMESAFTSVNVGIMVIEGLGRQLDPKLSLLEVGAPLLMSVIAHRQNAKAGAA